MKAFAIIEMANGMPNVDFAATPCRGYCLGAHLGNWGCYLLSGTGAQLAALNALPNVYGICVVTETGAKWAELDGTIAPAARTRLNTWLTARGYPTIPAGWTYRQVVLAIYKRLNDRFNLDRFDVTN